MALLVTAGLSLSGLATLLQTLEVVATGGAVHLLLRLLPVVGAVVAAIPYPVLGGAGIVLFGIDSPGEGRW